MSKGIWLHRSFVPLLKRYIFMFFVPPLLSAGHYQLACPPGLERLLKSTYKSELPELELITSNCKCIATSNKCLTSSNKKLLVTSASLLVTAVTKIEG